MPKVIRTKIAGVTKKNWDGESRQDLLELLSEGDQLILERDLLNEYDENAIAVHNRSDEQLGFINRDLAEDLAPLLDSGYGTRCVVQDVTGGDELEDGSTSSYGCNIEITLYSPEEWESTKPINVHTQPTRQMNTNRAGNASNKMLLDGNEKEMKKAERKKVWNTIAAIIWVVAIIILLSQCGNQ